MAKQVDYQFHITFDNFAITKKQDFINLCLKENVKPVIIVLPKGDYINQPMFTKLVSHNHFDTAMDDVQETIDAFKDYKLMRVKAEISPEHAETFQIPQSGFEPYFEWHCKVIVEDLVLVESICQKFGGHLSRNTLDEAGKERFVTVRLKEKAVFDKNVEVLLNELNNKGIKIIKQKFEYCVFDSKLELDRGWT